MSKNLKSLPEHMSKNLKSLPEQCRPSSLVGQTMEIEECETETGRQMLSQHRECCLVMTEHKRQMSSAPPAITKRCK